MLKLLYVWLSVFVLTFYVRITNANCIDDSIENCALQLDGGNVQGWDEGSWYIQVDGVMGGRSSGNLRFDDSGKTMVFTGEINLNGGGFSSVRRRFNTPLDLSSHDGVIIELESVDYYDYSKGPLGMEIQLSDTSSNRYDFAAGFAVPLAPTDDINVTTTSVFIPMSDFTRGASIGFRCSGCALDTTSVNGMDIYVLYQEGPFEARIKSITAVKENRAFGSPVVPALAATDAQNNIVELLEATIVKGSSLFNKDYIEMCAALYWSTVNTIIASSPSSSLKRVACAGITESMSSTADKSKSEIAWILRYTMDAMRADLLGENRENMAAIAWMPSKEETYAAVTVDNDYCSGITSTTSSRFYRTMGYSSVEMPSTSTTSLAEDMMKGTMSSPAYKRNRGSISILVSCFMSGVVAVITLSS